MNFFEQQELAKRRTLILILLFLAAVLGLIALTSMIVYFSVALDFLPGESNANIKLEWFLWVAVTIVSIVSLASFYRWFQVSKGGHSVVESMGVKFINESTGNAEERKLLNVVEEMAIASGSSVPEVCVIEDPAINAFAAGLTPQDAVIGATRGCIEHLSRSELQGVVAHEFSHIFNGDMRLNLKLVSLLYGIMFIGVLGELALGSGSRRCYHSSSDSGRGGFTAGKMALVGVGLIVIGWCGSFLGTWIKSAISRQREYLADASAVQFTRDASTISGALKKIGGFTLGSRLSMLGAEEFSHMFFGQSYYRMHNTFPTHPPLEDRIARVEPHWNGVFPKIHLVRPTPLEQKSEAKEKLEPIEFVSAIAGMGAQSVMASASAEITQVEEKKVSAALDNSVDLIGSTTAAHLDYSANLIHTIPKAFRDAAHDIFSARALIYVLVISLSDTDIQEKQLKLIRQRCDPGVYRETQRLYAAALELHRPQYFPLLELAVPTLKQVPDAHYDMFSKNLVSLVKADLSVSLFEFSLYAYLKHEIKPSAHGRSVKLVRVRHEMQLVFAAIMQEIGLESDQIKQQLTRAMEVLMFNPRDINPAALSEDPIPKKALNSALRRLQDLHPLQKPLFLKGLKQCIFLQSPPTVELTEFFRVVASLLDCPTPPLIAEKAA